MSFLKRWFGSDRERDEEQPEETTLSLPIFSNVPRAPAPTAHPNFPIFRVSAIDRPTNRAERGAIAQTRVRLREVFAPTQPVSERGQFAGRLGVLAKLIELIEQRSHVVVFGSRGIGKTSLMHVLADVARDAGYLVAYESCGTYSRFEEMFRAILGNIPTLYSSSVAPGEASAGGRLSDQLPAGSFTAREVGDICAQITGTRVLVILDEYDRLEDAGFRQNVAELIKNLSDRSARMQLLLAGVAADLQELIGYVPSIRRNVIGLPMPWMTQEEVQALIGLGEAATGIRFDPQVVEGIGILGNGSPYLLRLFSHHASMQALDDQRLIVTMEDLRGALDQILDESESRLGRWTVEQAHYLVAHFSLPFLGAVARAASTPDGSFRAGKLDLELAGMREAEALEALERIASKTGVLEAHRSTDVIEYRFRDEAMPNYLWLLVAREQFANASPEAGKGAAATI